MNLLDVNPTRIIQSLLMGGIGWLISLARDMNRRIKAMQTTLNEVAAWKTVHDENDERRFGRVEKDIERLRWRAQHDRDRSNGDELD